MKGNWGSGGGGGRMTTATYKGSGYQISQLTLYRSEESRMTYEKYSKIKNCQPTILYSAKLSFRWEGEMKTFPDKQKLRSLPPLDLPYNKKC